MNRGCGGDNVVLVLASYPLVDGEERGPLEGLPTLGTAIGSFPGVVPHVVLQARRALKGFTTLTAAVRSLCAPHVER